MKIDPLMARAVELGQAGRHREAAPIFLDIASRAHAQGDAMQFKLGTLAAAKSWVNAGEPKGAWVVAAKLLEQRPAGARGGETMPLMHKIVAMLRESGHLDEADGVSGDALRAFGGSWVDPLLPRLPAYCTHCGAPVRPGEAVRATPTTYACHFCGAALG